MDFVSETPVHCLEIKRILPGEGPSLLTVNDFGSGSAPACGVTTCVHAVSTINNGPKISYSGPETCCGQTGALPPACGCDGQPAESATLHAAPHGPGGYCTRNVCGISQPEVVASALQTLAAARLTGEGDAGRSAAPPGPLPPGPLPPRNEPDLATTRGSTGDRGRSGGDDDSKNGAAVLHLSSGSSWRGGGSSLTRELEAACSLARQLNHRAEQQLADLRCGAPWATENRTATATAALPSPAVAPVDGRAGGGGSRVGKAAEEAREGEEEGRGRLPVGGVDRWTAQLEQERARAAALSEQVQELQLRAQRSSEHHAAQLLSLQALLAEDLLLRPPTAALLPPGPPITAVSAATAVAAARATQSMSLEALEAAATAAAVMSPPLQMQLRATAAATAAAALTSPAAASRAGGLWSRGGGGGGGVALAPVSLFSPLRPWGPPPPPPAAAARERGPGAGRGGSVSEAQQLVQQLEAQLERQRQEHVEEVALLESKHRQEVQRLHSQAAASQQRSRELLAAVQRLQGDVHVCDQLISWLAPECGAGRGLIKS